MTSSINSLIRCGAIILAGLLATIAARADVVVLRSGERLEGRITMETSSRLILVQTSGNRTIDRATIDKIERSPVVPAPAPEAPVPSPEPIPAAKPAAATPVSALAPATAAKPGSAPVVASWPPVKGKTFPDLTLYDRTGQLVRLSSFRGKIIILEPVGMTCPACNAFSGGNQVGGFEGVQPQSDCPPLEKYFTAGSTGLTLDDPRIVWVQLLLYNMSMQAPSVDDLKRWSAHFPAVRKPNCVVLAATPEMLGNASYAMIPGVQLIDRQFILRSDFRGHGGGDSLSGHLLPLVRELTGGSGQ